MRPSIAAALLMAFIAAACGEPSTTPTVPETVVATATPVAAPLSPAPTTPGETAEVTATPVVATITPTASPTQTPTAAPTAAMPAPVEIVRFSQLGTRLTVEIRNPNDDFGLVRSAFELAVIGDDGGIIAVVGGQGLPGASCCTIYHLPPGGRYGLTEEFLPVGADVASVELTVLSRWEIWSELDPAEVTLSNVTLRDEGFAGGERIFTLTGRVQVDQPGPFNTVVQGFVDAGDGFFVIEAIAECVGAGGARAFEGQTFAEAGRDATLGEIAAFVTTVEGAGDTDEPPGC